MLKVVCLRKIVQIVVNPLAQVVTNINYQHQEWVHPKTITEICKQKVGYLSENTRIYIGKQNFKNKQNN